MRRLCNYLLGILCADGDWLAFLDDMGEWKPKRWFVVVLRILGIGLLFMVTAWLLGLINVGSTSGNSGTSFSNFGPVGDYFGGIMAPFIGLIGAILTFAAFYVQFKANESQRDAIAKQDTELKRQSEQLANQERQRKADVFEQRFFELLRIHRENAVGMRFDAQPFIFFDLKEGVNWGTPKTYQHHEVVEVINIEFEAVYKFLIFLEDRRLLESMEPFNRANFAYGMVFVGQRTIPDEWPLPGSLVERQKKIAEAQTALDQFIGRGCDIADYVEGFSDAIFNGIQSVRGANHAPKMLQGYTGQLSAYYRHLFQMVRQLDELDSEIMDIARKKELAKTLRAQLTDEDQLLLYYNSLWVIGDVWWKNGYMTNYNFIKHVPMARIPNEISPVKRLSKHLKETDLKEL